MKKLLSIFLLVFLIVGLVACSSNEEKVDKEALAEDGSLGVFYEVSEGDNTVYLFGSVHIGNEEMYPVHPKVEEAYSKASVLGVEVDINNINQMELAQAMTSIAIYQDGTSLKDHLSTEVYEEVVSIGASVGLEEFMIAMYKPAFVSDLITNYYAEQNGYSAELGIDQYFLDRAAEDEKVVEALESLQSQLEIMTILEEETQIKMLEDMLANKDNYSQELDLLVNAWVAGDEQTFESMRAAEEYDSEDYLRYKKALSDDRDQEMANKIEGFLQSKEHNTYFVVVGTLHLVGENSIVDVLRKKGYEVKSGFGQ